MDRLVDTLSPIGSFWLSEVRRDHADHAPETMIDAYLAILAEASNSRSMEQGREVLGHHRRSSDR
jgi:hypothetical protein